MPSVVVEFTTMDGRVFRYVIPMPERPPLVGFEALKPL